MGSFYADEVFTQVSGGVAAKGVHREFAARRVKHLKMNFAEGEWRNGSVFD